MRNYFESEIKRKKENKPATETPYDRLKLLMRAYMDECFNWLVGLGFCGLVWCSIWFVWRWINK
jgi:hypothetical protein